MPADAKDYAELMKKMKEYCDHNITSKTKSIMALIEQMMIDFEKDDDLTIYVNDVKISQFVLNEIHTTDWTNAEKIDFEAKTWSAIQSFRDEGKEAGEEDDEEEIYAHGYDYGSLMEKIGDGSLMEKIVVYCNENSNAKTQNMVEFIETGITGFKVDNALTEERSLYVNYVLLYNSMIDKMDSDDWTDDERVTMAVNTEATITEFCNGKEIDICDICEGVRIM